MEGVLTVERHGREVTIPLLCCPAVGVPREYVTPPARNGPPDGAHCAPQLHAPLVISTPPATAAVVTPSVTVSLTPAAIKAKLDVLAAKREALSHQGAAPPELAAVQEAEGQLTLLLQRL